MTDCSHHPHEVVDHAGDGAGNSRRLLIALCVIVAFMLLEVVGGVLSGSLALLADATHMLTDALALGLAACAQMIARRPPDRLLHFGYRRLQVLAAFVNGILMAVLLCWIIVEAVQRFVAPVAVEAPMMLWIAAAGLVANIAAFLVLHGGETSDVNIRGALLHVIGDLLGSVAAIAGALVIITTGWVRIDPVLSIVVAGLIGISAFRLIRETGMILLEAAPSNIEIGDVEESLRNAAPEICDAHQIRIWQLTPQHLRITLHLIVEDAKNAPAAVRAAKRLLTEKYGIHQSTIQVDVGDDCPDRAEEGEAAPRSAGLSASSPPRQRAASPARSAFAANQH